MDKFCGSKFWDWNLTWYTDSPQFTSCFEETILIWLPSSFLILFSFYDLHITTGCKARRIPWGWLNLSKLVNVGILLLLTFVDFTYAYVWHPRNLVMFKVDYTSAIVKHITFFVCGVLVVIHRKRGVRTSAITFLFWLLLVICSIPHYLTQIQRGLDNGNHIRIYPYISNVIYFPIILNALILEFYIDARPILSEYSSLENLTPDTNTSFINNVFAGWFDSFAFKFYRKPVKMRDMWNLKYEDRTEYLVTLFEEKWNAARRLRQSRQTSIIPVLWKCFSSDYIMSTVLKIISDVLMFASPQILSLLINYEESGNDEPGWHGYFYVLLLVLAGLIQTTFLNNYAFQMFRLGLRLRTTLMSVIFRKVLRISNKVKETFTVGDISNLMSVDAQRFYDSNLYLNATISAPVIIIACLYFLWRLIGLSAFAGLALMLIIVPINVLVGRKTKELQGRQMYFKDQRVKITGEVLSGIKTLKMYAWEPSFERKIFELRQEEVNTLKMIGYLNTAISFIWVTAPFLVSLLTFAVFILSDAENVLTAEIAFVSLSLFNLMKFPISLLPRTLSSVVQTWVATKRINKFLNAEELDSNAVTHDAWEPYQLSIENGTFTWNDEQEIATLTNINVHIKRGDLVMVIGPVGCGKSSLLSALLGEMRKLGGRINTNGTIAYAPQQAWLQNASIRDNILFTNSFKSDIYDRVVQSCALIADFQILPAGDATEIGEKGINLSGGQKQRINLARAAYSNSDIYILDDPLSAVDVQVGRHIFENVIGPEGMLKKKTRLLATHSTTFLTSADLIIVMKNGTVVETGSYNDLLKRKTEFAEFLNNGATVNEETVQHSQSRPNIRETVQHNNDFVARKIFKEAASNLVHENVNAGEKLMTEENIAEGKIKLSVYSHYLKSGGSFLWMAALIFNLLYQALNIGSNLWLTIWSSDIGVESKAKRYYYLEIYLVYGLAQAGAIIVATMTMYMATSNASARLHNELLKKVLRWPTKSFDVTPLGRIISRLSFDVDVIDNVFPFTLRQLFTLGGTVLSTFCVISYSSPLFIVFMLPMIILYILLQRLYISMQRQFKRFEAVSRGPVFSLFSETISGISTIRAYDSQNKFIIKADEQIYRNAVHTYPSMECLRWISLRLDCLGNVIIFLASLFAVLGKGSANSGVLALSITYALQITGSLNWTIRTVSDIETNIISVERIQDYDNTSEENIYTDSQPIPPTWPQKGAIIFDNLQMRYRDGLNLVLRGLSAEIRSEEKIGIIGRTGSGKSSLTLSLFRMVEAAGGKIIIDGIDIAKVNLPTLRSRITVIPQDPVLFSETVRFNLDPFFEYSDHELWRVLELASLKNYIKSLPGGLDSKISENGDNLSVGQRQLICLARALLRKTKILVLDEATAAIDLETDRIIQKAIRSEFKKCTVLTIAHKLNTVMDCDRIMVLENGAIKEFDSPHVLLSSKDSIFYKMTSDTTSAIRNVARSEQVD